MIIPESIWAKDYFTTHRFAIIKVDTVALVSLLQSSFFDTFYEKIEQLWKDVFVQFHYKV